MMEINTTKILANAGRLFAAKNSDFNQIMDPHNLALAEADIRYIVSPIPDEEFLKLSPHQLDGFTHQQISDEVVWSYPVYRDGGTGSMEPCLISLKIAADALINGNNVLFFINESNNREERKSAKLVLFFINSLEKFSSHTGSPGD